MGRTVANPRHTPAIPPGFQQLNNSELMAELWFTLAAAKHPEAFPADGPQPSTVEELLDSDLLEDVQWADWWRVFPYELREQGSLDEIDALGLLLSSSISRSRFERHFEQLASSSGSSRQQQAAAAAAHRPISGTTTNSSSSSRALARAFGGAPAPRQGMQAGHAGFGFDDTQWLNHLRSTAALGGEQEQQRVGGSRIPRRRLLPVPQLVQQQRQHQQQQLQLGQQHVAYVSPAAPDRALSTINSTGLRYPSGWALGPQQPAPPITNRHRLAPGGLTQALRSRQRRQRRQEQQQQLQEHSLQAMLQQQLQQELEELPDNDVEEQELREQLHTQLWGLMQQHDARMADMAMPPPPPPLLPPFPGALRAPDSPPPHVLFQQAFLAGHGLPQDSGDLGALGGGSYQLPAVLPLGAELLQRQQQRQQQQQQEEEEQLARQQRQQPWWAGGEEEPLQYEEEEEEDQDQQRADTMLGLLQQYMLARERSTAVRSAERSRAAAAVVSAAPAPAAVAPAAAAASEPTAAAAAASAGPVVPAAAAAAASGGQRLTGQRRTWQEACDPSGPSEAQQAQQEQPAAAEDAAAIAAAAGSGGAGSSGSSRRVDFRRVARAVHECLAGEDEDLLLLVSQIVPYSSSRGLRVKSDTLQQLRRLASSRAVPPKVITSISDRLYQHTPSGEAHLVRLTASSGFSRQAAAAAAVLDCAERHGVLPFYVPLAGLCTEDEVEAAVMRGLFGGLEQQQQEQQQQEQPQEASGAAAAGAGAATTGRDSAPAGGVSSRQAAGGAEAGAVGGSSSASSRRRAGLPGDLTLADLDAMVAVFGTAGGGADAAAAAHEESGGGGGMPAHLQALVPAAAGAAAPAAGDAGGPLSQRPAGGRAGGATDSGRDAGGNSSSSGDVDIDQLAAHLTLLGRCYSKQPMLLLLDEVDAAMTPDDGRPLRGVLMMLLHHLPQAVVVITSSSGLDAWRDAAVLRQVGEPVVQQLYDGRLVLVEHRLPRTPLQPCCYHFV